MGGIDIPHENIFYAIFLTIEASQLCFFLNFIYRSKWKCSVVKPKKKISLAKNSPKFKLCGVVKKSKKKVKTLKNIKNRSRTIPLMKFSTQDSTDKINRKIFEFWEILKTCKNAPSIPVYNTEFCKTVDYGTSSFKRPLTAGSNSSIDSSEIRKHTCKIVKDQDVLAKKFGLQEDADLFDLRGRPKILDFIGKDYRPRAPRNLSSKKSNIEVKIKFLVAKRKGRFC
ncbi:unnamed protein product [Moneuplotes crassus]|uniref:Uncharacterized protein n=1 Tax=Euplotes crassus TaxID=5936 RepID=A0AAD1UDD0_EUPCR|nr:unnamed protein product [Moneuplotes crassus]